MNRYTTTRKRSFLLLWTVLALLALCLAVGLVACSSGSGGSGGPGNGAPTVGTNGY